MLCSSCKPFLSLSIDADISADTDLLGKSVTDLQENIEISNGEITGTLKYVTGYTGFSSKTAERKGNYLALHVDTPDDAEATVELIGGTVGKPVTLDADRLIVLRITDPATQSIEVVTTLGGESVTQTYSISNLVLEPEA